MAQSRVYLKTQFAAHFATFIYLCSCKSVGYIAAFSGKQLIYVPRVAHAVFNPAIK